MKNSTTVEDILVELHTEVAKDLLARVRSGEATAAELAAAIKFLKDNSITSAPEPGDTAYQLKEALPKFDDDPAQEVY